MNLDTQYMNEEERLVFLRSIMGGDFQSFLDAYVDKLFKEMADAFYKDNMRLTSTIYNRIRLVLDLLDSHKS